MTEKKRDIKELKELLVLALKLGEATKKSLADGKFDFNDMPNYLVTIPYLQPALEGITEIPEEVKDLDENELEELATLIAVDLGKIVEAPKLVAQINAGLKLIKAAREFYQTLK